uniref:Uncharacterized protein n=1 Tax=Panagrolaimus sp. JU765 TaxID=591449 RepID=A0AC34RJD8_9BILA
MPLSYENDWGLHPESTKFNDLTDSDINDIKLKLEAAGINVNNASNLEILAKPVKFLTKLEWAIIFILLISTITPFYFLVNRVPNSTRMQELREFSEERVVDFLEQINREEEMDLFLLFDKINIIGSITERHYPNVFKILIHNGESCIGTDVECLKRSGNFAILIAPKDEQPTNSVLINCDLALTKTDFEEHSPIPCFMALDVLQTIVFNNYTFSNRIVFSFNLIGGNYNQSPILHLVDKYKVNAFINLTGADGQEILLSSAFSPLRTIFLDHAQFKPVSSVVESLFFADSYIDQKGNLTTLEIYYSPSTKSYADFMKNKKVGRLQRAGTNLFNFIFGLSFIRDFSPRSLKIFSRKYEPVIENHDFLFVSYKNYALLQAETVVFIIFFLTFIGMYFLSYFYLVRKKQLEWTSLFVHYLAFMGCVLFANVVLYLFSGIFNYLPFINWDNGAIFLRNTFLHFLLTLVIFFKITENIDPKLALDFEQMYFTFGIFFPLFFMTLIFSTVYITKIGYFLLFITLPLALATYFPRLSILGFARMHSSPKTVFVMILILLLPSIFVIAETVIMSFQSLRYAKRDSYQYIFAGFIGFISSIILSDFTWISQNMICDWGAPAYIPLSDCPWMQPVAEEVQPAFEYSKDEEFPKKEPKKNFFSCFRQKPKVEHDPW